MSVNIEEVIQWLDELASDLVSQGDTSGAHIIRSSFSDLRDEFQNKDDTAHKGRSFQLSIWRGFVWTVEAILCFVGIITLLFVWLPPTLVIIWRLIEWWGSKL